MLSFSRRERKKGFQARSILLCLVIACFMLQASCMQATSKKNTVISSAKSQVTVTILYDNYAFAENVQADWGFSCLIQGTEKTILFDTGARDEILLKNSDILQVGSDNIDQIVISHNHQDHTGGLITVLEMNPGASIYIPASFPKLLDSTIKMKTGKLVRVEKPIEICKQVFSTGEMGDRIKEQSLILDTRNGLVIITGCSHQGIVNILKRAKEMFHGKEIYMVFGGFHLLQTPRRAIKEIIQEFKTLGVQKCGATHCTGEYAITLFEEAFGENFMNMGVGKVIQVEMEGSF